MSYEDAKHRPHAIHTGEEPSNPITDAVSSLRVTLDRWGPVTNLFTSMYDALQANWGESPSRTINRRGQQRTYVENDGRVFGEFYEETGWCYLTSDERDYVEACFAGKTLQQVLEGVTFDFCIDGVSRAFTHQNVRTRLGAGFMQHGGRDNDWRHRPWTMPETMRRMCECHGKGLENLESRYAPPIEGMKTGMALEHCVSDWNPIDEYCNTTFHFDGFSDDIRGRIEHHIAGGRKLYAALVDAGIPWQDARRVLFMGMQTYIHDQYNYLALQGVLANRLEHIMDWEFNAVAQLMLREIKMKCPPLLSMYLGSHSDKAKSAKFAGLESWPPDGKYPNPYERCKTCGHSEGNHTSELCEACAREGRYADGYAVPSMNSVHRYEGVDTRPRQHRAEQMPFFVLTPKAMAGGPIEWIPTNGKYPHEVISGIGR